MGNMVLPRAAIREIVLERRLRRIRPEYASVPNINTDEMRETIAQNILGVQNVIDFGNIKHRRSENLFKNLEKEEEIIKKDEDKMLIEDESKAEGQELKKGENSTNLKPIEKLNMNCFDLNKRRLYTGQWVDVKDTIDQWLEGQVLAVSEDGKMVKIHYNKWSERWDEWINTNSDRIMPFRYHTRQACVNDSVSPLPNKKPDGKVSLLDFDGITKRETKSSFFGQRRSRERTEEQSTETHNVGTSDARVTNINVEIIPEVPEHNVSTPTNNRTVVLNSNANGNNQANVGSNESTINNNNTINTAPNNNNETLSSNNSNILETTIKPNITENSNNNTIIPPGNNNITFPSDSHQNPISPQVPQAPQNLTVPPLNTMSLEQNNTQNQAQNSETAQPQNQETTENPNSNESRYVKPPPKIKSPKKEKVTEDYHIIKNMGNKGFIGVFKEIKNIEESISPIINELIDQHDIANNAPIQSEELKNLQIDTYFNIKRIIPVLDRLGRIYTDTSTLLNHLVRKGKLKVLNNNLFKNNAKDNELLKQFTIDEQVNVDLEILNKNTPRENRSGTLNYVPPRNIFEKNFTNAIPLIDTPLSVKKKENMSNNRPIFDVYLHDDGGDSGDDGDDDSEGGEQQQQNNRINVGTNTECINNTGNNNNASNSASNNASNNASNDNSGNNNSNSNKENQGNIKVTNQKEEKDIKKNEDKNEDYELLLNKRKRSRDLNDSQEITNKTRAASGQNFK